MSERPAVLVHSKDLELEERVRTSIEKRCANLAEEFREVARFELSFEANGAGFIVHGHATGKNTDVASHAEASEPGPAADRVLEKIERSLRKQHDKRIFAQRRDAQRDPPKRRPSG
jgi:ribosome-associated translation inhibitor RaiA